MKPLTVAIITRNRPKLLDQCLASIASQKTPPDSLIIIENDTHSTIIPVLKRYPNLPIIHHLIPQSNLATLRNHALSLAKTPFLAFIDDDCVADKNWVKSIKTCLSQPLVAACIGHHKNRFPQNRYARLEQSLHESWFSQYYPLQQSADFNSGMFFNTRNCALNATLINQYQLQFSPSAPHKIEDTDFGLKLLKTLPSQYRLVYLPSMIVHHANSTSLTEFFARRIHSGRGKYFLDTHHPHFEPPPIHQPAPFKTDYWDKLLLQLEHRLHDLAYFLEKNGL